MVLLVKKSESYENIVKNLYFLYFYKNYYINEDNIKCIKNHEDTDANWLMSAIHPRSKDYF